MVFIILPGCFPCSNVSIIRECECTNGTDGSYYGTNNRKCFEEFHAFPSCFDVGDITTGLVCIDYFLQWV